MNQRPTILHRYHKHYRQATQPLRTTPIYRHLNTGRSAQLRRRIRMTLAFATNEAHEWSEWLIAHSIMCCVRSNTLSLVPAGRAATPGVDQCGNAGYKRFQTHIDRFHLYLAVTRTLRARVAHVSRDSRRVQRAYRTICACFVHVSHV